MDVEAVSDPARELAKRLNGPEGREALRQSQERTRLRTEEAERLSARRVDPFRRVTPLGR